MEGESTEKATQKEGSHNQAAKVTTMNINWYEVDKDCDHNRGLSHECVRVKPWSTRRQVNGLSFERPWPCRSQGLEPRSSELDISVRR